MNNIFSFYFETISAFPWHIFFLKARKNIGKNHHQKSLNSALASVMNGLIIYNKGS
jgi:hypothetical protein